MNVKLFDYCPFSLPYKVEQWKPSTKNPPSRYIVGMEIVGECEQVCISVSSEDKLYLTNDFIVTHNTTITKSIAEELAVSVQYAAFAGKAALQMQKSGCFGASTIHSLIYKPLVDQETGTVHFEKVPEILSRRYANLHH